MELAIYKKKFSLNFTQCYANGKLKYSELNNLLQITAAEHAEVLGLGYMDMAQHQQAWVLARLRIEIDAMPTILQDITVSTWIQEFMGNRTVRNFAVQLGEKHIIVGSSLWAVFNTELRKAENLAQPVDLSIIFPERKATQQPVHRIEPLKQYSSADSYTSKISDLDFINHVNNVKYTDWCIDMLSQDQVFKDNFRSMDMNYLRELKYDETVSILKEEGDSAYHFAVQRKKKNIFLMTIEK